MPLYNITINEDVRGMLLRALEALLEHPDDLLDPSELEEAETIQGMLRNSIPGENNQNDFQL